MKIITCYNLLFALLLTVGCQLPISSEKQVLEMEHGLQSDRYDYLWHAAVAILISEEISDEDIDASKDLSIESRRSLAEWNKLSVKSRPISTNQLRNEIWERYLFTFRGIMEEHPNHPYWSELKKACKELEYLNESCMKADAQSNSATEDHNIGLAWHDSDGDGLSDRGEAEFGTDPTVPDTDGDGVSDLEEFFMQYFPIWGKGTKPKK